MERRKYRRMDIEAPLLIRRFIEGSREPFDEQVTGNVSLAGVYFESKDATPYKLNEVVMTSVVVPEPKTRDFPFTRLAGRGRVVRVKELSGDASGRKRFGIAVEYGDDLTALTAIPGR